MLTVGMTLQFRSAASSGSAVPDDPLCECVMTQFFNPIRVASAHRNQDFYGVAAGQA
jgi:hypothetical protein